MKDLKLTHKTLVRIAAISLVISLLSSFTTIVGYTNAAGVHRNFSLFDFLSENGGGFDEFVGREYVGYVFWDIDISVIRIFVFIGIGALLCAVAGLIQISAQKENRSSFALAVAGLVLTMIPSMVLLISTIALGDRYLGRIYCGIYPLVCPVSMGICIYTTTEMHRKNLVYQKKLDAAGGMIYKAGDL